MAKMTAEQALDIVLNSRDHSKEMNHAEEQARAMLRTLVAMRQAQLNNNAPVYYKLARELRETEERGIY